MYRCVIIRDVISFGGQEWRAGGFDKFYKFNREKIGAADFQRNRPSLSFHIRAAPRSRRRRRFRFPRREPEPDRQISRVFQRGERAIVPRAARGARHAAALADGMRARRVPASPRRSTLGALRAVCHGDIYAYTRANTHSVGGLSGAHTGPRRKLLSVPPLLFGSSEISFAKSKLDSESRFAHFRIKFVQNLPGSRWREKMLLESGIITRLF